MCQKFDFGMEQKMNITTQSVASPRTPHLSMILIVTFTFELWPPKSIGFTMVNMSAKFDQEAHDGLVCIWFTAYFHTCSLWPWPLTSDLQNWVHPLTRVKFPYLSIVTLTFDLWPSNRVHPLIMVNRSAKYDKEIHNGLVSILFTSLSPYMSIVTLTFDLKNGKIIRVHPLIMVNMSAKFDQEICNGLVSFVFTSLSPYMSIVTLTFDLWPPKSIGFILSSGLTCLPSLTKKYVALLASCLYFVIEYHAPFPVEIHNHFFSYGP